MLLTFFKDFLPSRNAITPFQGSRGELERVEGTTMIRHVGNVSSLSCLVAVGFPIVIS
jgi:hypothetical protein